ncbi:hypothetical protein BC835DRAFT_1320065 [Cytidiella melzeri]|nr:hypothetical protein BC835DRAFT_1320065 [Cytidiella melzeri]
MPQNSAIPFFYWVLFGCYEPFLSITGAIGAFLYPQQTYEQQAPWPNGSPPDGPMARATIVTLYQLAHTVSLLGFINLFMMWTIRKHLWTHPAMQERVMRALLTPLLVADFLHIGLTLWALGEERWDVSQWGGILWITIVSGFTLMIPRIAWHLGIGRYVHERDGHQRKATKE